ncbi:hypothetical protein [Gordonia paraffinivorans]|uniref:hypothetical protein n=1 Tax=Gordonia paraffinivorans TaxID=175628 RepID=UPI0028A01349|nr:hypothetical protein [Gordonia paraffinivorans]
MTHAVEHRGAHRAVEPAQPKPPKHTETRTWVLFALGCVLLVLIAANLTHLSEWAVRWGQIPVFLAFFLLMSLAGRWFWAGCDAIIGRLRRGDGES